MRFNDLRLHPSDKIQVRVKKLFDITLTWTEEEGQILLRLCDLVAP